MSTVNSQRFFRVLETEKSVNISGICGKEKETTDFTDWYRRYLRRTLSSDFFRNLETEKLERCFELRVASFEHFEISAHCSWLAAHILSQIFKFSDFQFF